MTQFKAWREQQEKAKCEKNVTNLAEFKECFKNFSYNCLNEVIRQACWIGSTDTKEGECGIVNAGFVLKVEQGMILSVNFLCNGPKRGNVRVDLT